MGLVAQLIKLLDYVSRYETDMYRYPGQFIRLKQDNWRKMYSLWKERKDFLPEDQEGTKQHNSTLSKWKNIFLKKASLETAKEEEEETLPDTEEELKRYFLDGLHPFQLKWASSTIIDMSFMERRFHYDPTLRYFLQRFPDTYLLMYEPLFRLKNTSMEGDLILISPIGIEIIHLLEKKPDVTIIAGDERNWYTEENSIESRILSPLISLKRTEQVIRSVLKNDAIDFPVKKVVLSRTNSIAFNIEPYNTFYIGMREVQKWFEEKRGLVSPLKHRQLKAGAVLLEHCQTTAVKRPEWDREEQFSEDSI